MDDKTVIHIRISRKKKRSIRVMAARKDQDMSKFIRDAVDAHIIKTEKELLNQLNKELGN